METLSVTAPDLDRPDSEEHSLRTAAYAQFVPLYRPVLPKADRCPGVERGHDARRTAAAGAVVMTVLAAARPGSVAEGTAAE